MRMLNGYGRIVGALVALTLCTGAPIAAQVVKKGALSGTLHSGAATAGPGETATVLTTASNGVTILLRVCGAKALGGENPTILVTGSTLGLLATFGSDASENEGGGACVDLSPGLVLPAGEEVRCADAGGTNTVACTAMALVSRK